MPLPKVQDKESEEEFISRCIPMVIEEEGLDADSDEDREQASAICYSQWREEGEEKAVESDNEQGLTVSDVKGIVSQMLENREPDTLISTGGGVKALGDGLVLYAHQHWWRRQGARRWPRRRLPGPVHLRRRAGSGG